MGQVDQELIGLLEHWGIVFIILTGSLLHFAWAWCGRCLTLAPVAAINESVWEHLKLAFWPTVAWGLIELALVRRIPGNFCLGKALAAYLAPLVIVTIYYTYTAVLRHHVLAIDGLSFVIAVVAGQLLSRRLMSVPDMGVTVNSVACLAILLLGAVFAVFTFKPPRMPIFRDPLTGGYGV